MVNWIDVGTRGTSLVRVLVEGEVPTRISITEQSERVTSEEGLDYWPDAQHPSRTELCEAVADTVGAFVSIGAWKRGEAAGEEVATLTMRRKQPTHRITSKPIGGRTVWTLWLDEEEDGERHGFTSEDLDYGYEASWKLTQIGWKYINTIRWSDAVVTATELPTKGVV